MGLAFRSTAVRTLVRARKFAAGFGKDVAGNTLVIVGIAMIPLAAMIGSGVDMSRGYMAQARMQQACDAGALAGRRAMTNSVVDQTVKNEATKFFNFNFKTGTTGVAGTAAYGAKGFTPVVSDAADSATTVVINATTTIPTTVMKMFGSTDMTLTVTCNAKQDFVNTDVVLVLDTTGSMRDDVNNNNVNSGATSKIVALRAAVLALYDELAPVQTQLETAGLRLRYGIVPYSSGVNIGKVLRGVNTGYMVSDNWTYQSRQANWTNVISSYSSSNSTVVTVETYSGTPNSNNCNKYAANTSFGSFSPSPSGSPLTSGSAPVAPNSGASPASMTTTTYSLNSYNSSTQTCKRNKTVVTTSYAPVYTQVFSSWTYQPVSYDVSQYVQGNSVTTQTGSSGTDVSSTWAGCIEERDTVSSITTTTTTIPSGAKDLDVNLIPTDNASRWRPYWPELIYRPDNGNQPQVACPVAEAKRLQAWTRANLSTYLNTLNADGGTYHDNGMRWAARLISSGGVFAADNPTTYGNMPVSKHIIFMTDGIIDTGDTLYSTYGMERWDKRITGGWTSDADQTGRHDQRFKMMCAATKGMGVSIWVVAFASTLTSSLSECASNANQASLSSNSTQLTARFVEIGKNIGSLRLTQ